MFNLLVKYSAWADGRDVIPAGRAFEYTDTLLENRFRPNGQFDLAALYAMPTLFVEERSSRNEQVARVGTIIRAKMGAREISLEYSYDSDIPPITNTILESIAVQLDMDPFEFSRTHWAVKDVDLFRVLIRNLQPRRPRPRVFQLSEVESIEPVLVSAMMPFHPSFDVVYTALKDVAAEVGLRCRRADDIWENPAVIQDVVSLIDRSRIVICDCTGRNPNVFYEAGIAHTLGREVILITQSEADIPFDLRHLRYVHYLNNGEGLRVLGEQLKHRLESLTQ